MASHTNVLNEGMFGNDKMESTDKIILTRDSKNEVINSKVKLLDITQQQWFWDQGVMS